MPNIQLYEASHPTSEDATADDEHSEKQEPLKNMHNLHKWSSG